MSQKSMKCTFDSDIFCICRIETLTKQYTDLEDEFRLALQIESNRFQEVRKSLIVKVKVLPCQTWRIGGAYLRFNNPRPHVC